MSKSVLVLTELSLEKIAQFYLKRLAQSGVRMFYAFSKEKFEQMLPHKYDALIVYGSGNKGLLVKLAKDAVEKKLCPVIFMYTLNKPEIVGATCIAAFDALDPLVPPAEHLYKGVSTVLGL